jgi:glucokinase
VRAVGVDVGGSTIAVAALEDDGRLSGLTESALPTRDYDGLLRVVAEQVSRLAPPGSGPAPPLGVAMAAWLSPDRERVLAAANLGWNDRELRRDLARVTGLDTTVHNDGNCAAWGEYLRAGSAAAGCLVMLTLGTDVGGGVVVDGRLLTGASSVAGELGHLRVGSGEEVCVCGSTGCLSLYASGTAMVRRARALVRDRGPEAALLRDLCGDAPDRFDGPMLAEAVRAGDPAAGSVVDVAATAIAAASSQVSRVVDHDVLVLGGGVIGLGPALVSAVQAALDRTDPVGPIRPRPAVVAARAGTSAGVLGAADLAARAVDRAVDRSVDGAVVRPAGRN